MNGDGSEPRISRRRGERGGSSYGSMRVDNGVAWWRKPSRSGATFTADEHLFYPWVSPKRGTPSLVFSAAPSEGYRYSLPYGAFPSAAVVYTRTAARLHYIPRAVVVVHLVWRYQAWHVDLWALLGSFSCILYRISLIIEKSRIGMAETRGRKARDYERCGAGGAWFLPPVALTSSRRWLNIRRLDWTASLP